MTTIETAAAAASPAPLTPETTTIDDSIAEVITILSGKKHSSNELSQMKMSEDVLYASLVYDSLKKDKPAAATLFKNDLKRHFDARTKRADSQPLAKSVNDILNSAVAGKKISKSAADSISQTAFGKAQLDGNKGSLGRSARSGGIATVLSKISTNGEPAKGVFDRFEKSVTTLQFIPPAEARKQRKELDKILSSLKAGATPAQNPVQNPAQNPSTATGTTSQSNSGIEGNPNELVYKPTATNGNISVAIPVIYADSVAGVTLLDEKGTEVTGLKSKGIQKDGRLLFEGDTTAAKLKTIHTLHLKLNDGVQTIDYILQSGDAGFTKQYMGS